jgi:pimeloyl-ACP methyl ester carboxylesterase
MATHVLAGLPEAQLTAGKLWPANFPPRDRVTTTIWQALSVCLLLMLQGCSSPWMRLIHSAQQAGVSHKVMSGAGFTHAVFVKTEATSVFAPVVVFIEGDGMPWRNLGWQPSPDPRPLNALAFKLFLHTPGTAWYITRPCYDDSLLTAVCNSSVWTDARYSAANVSSMVVALRRFATEQQVKQLLLVGYSGGGTLAVLMATQMPEVVGVVTIAANLDQVAWAQAHRYSPLVGSLNPATDTQELSVRHVALQGLSDSNVPVQTLSGFITTHPATQWWYLKDYDHVCCWERDWSSLWPQVQGKLSAQ